MTEGAPVNRKFWMRQIHRWTSIAFTVGVIMNIVAMRGGAQPPAWVGMTALIPLLVLLATGLYLFVQPYFARLRAGAKAALPVEQQRS